MSCGAELIWYAQPEHRRTRERDEPGRGWHGVASSGACSIGVGAGDRPSDHNLAPAFYLEMLPTLTPRFLREVITVFAHAADATLRVVF